MSVKMEEENYSHDGTGNGLVKFGSSKMVKGVD